jgi:hypothetical protein
MHPLQLSASLVYDVWIAPLSSYLFLLGSPSENRSKKLDGLLRMLEKLPVRPVQPNYVLPKLTDNVIVEEKCVIKESVI